MRHLEEVLRAARHRPHAAHPRHLREARADAGRASRRSSWPSSSYLLPRLAGHGTELSRLGGGIGTRGPGETKLETDRRRIRRRIATIAAEHRGQSGERRARLRERRQKSDVPDGRAGRLHQRRQDDAVQPADRRRGA
ncbi:MAG: hypothetical protein MZV64_72930 [Ignavibacteriales bacterium]|nr:hypothetical protein [Ignavibacteriales bacterium]